MDSILDWIRREGIIFRGGSGSGINLSRLRSSKEQLSKGGHASGPVSFMRGADASAGTIKSGGATRRAAKMVVLDARDVLSAEVHVEAGFAEDPDLLLFARLCLDEFLDIGVVHVEYDHFRGPAGGTSRLDRAGRGVGAAHEGDRPAGRAARGQQFLAGPDAGEVHAGA